MLKNIKSIKINLFVTFCWFLLLFVGFLPFLQVDLLLFVTFCWFLLEFIYTLFTSYFKLNIFCINILFL